MIKYRCDNCGVEMDEQDLRYILKVQLYAAPNEIRITAEDLQKDTQAELERLVERMKTMDPKKLEEEVYVDYQLDLCPKCRTIFAKRVEAKELI